MSDYGYQIFDANGRLTHSHTDQEIKVFSSDTISFRGSTLPQRIDIDLRRYSQNANVLFIMSSFYTSASYLEGGRRRSWVAYAGSLFSVSYPNAHTARLTRLQSRNIYDYNTRKFFSSVTYIVGRRI